MARLGPIGNDAFWSRWGVGQGRARAVLNGIPINDPQDGRAPLAHIATSGLGTLTYNLDAASDSWIQLDSSVGTSSATIAMAVPVAKFSGAASGDFVYLYSRMGDHTPTSGGYESWSAAVVPASCRAVPLRQSGRSSRRQQHFRHSLRSR